MRQRLTLSLVVTLILSLGGLLVVLVTKTHPALGLDLQGGISVTQQPVGDYEPASLDLAVERIRDRVDSLGVSEPEIVRQGDAIVVNLPGVKNQQEAIDLVKVTGQVYLRPVLQCFDAPAVDTSDTTGGTTGDTTGDTATDGTAVIDDTTPGTSPDTTAAGGPSRAPRSVDTSTPTSDTPTAGTATADTSTVGTDDIATAPTGTDGAPTTTVDLLGDPIDPATATTAAPSDPNGTEVLPLLQGGSCYVGPQQGTGTVFQNNAAADIVAGKWAVSVGLRNGAAGEDIWNALASQCYNGTATCPTKQLAIDLDGTIVSAPTVNAPSFSGNVEISGGFSESYARDLARVLTSGSLPVRMETKSVQTVSPTLGKDSLRAAIISGLIGVGLVLLFMMLYYRALGLVVLAGVIVSSALLYTVISFLSRTQGLALSLSGVAGVIVSIGVTVDSYVVFFERLKDEVRSGRTMRNSAQRGFAGAWHTILVADLVSLIGALVLWYLTVGSVRNFAFFLGLSTLIDLITAWTFTRPTVLLLARTKWMARRKVMGIEAVQAAAGGVS